MKKIVSLFPFMTELVRSMEIAGCLTNGVFSRE